MHRILSGISLVVFCVLTFAFDISAENQDKLDALAATVVFLRNEITDSLTQEGKVFEIWLKAPGDERFIAKTHTVTGTGFLVVKGKSDLFLVTAAHVASSMDEYATVTLRADLKRPISIPLAELSGRLGAPSWSKHGYADVACLRLAPTREVSSVLKKHFLAISMLSSEQSAPSRDTELLVLGFPLGFGVIGLFSPISQKSSAASGLMEIKSSDSEPASTYFLLQDPSVGGFSGAPVFDLRRGSFSGTGLTVRAGKPKVVGLVKGTISDKTGGKFAAVVPAWLVIETLNVSN